jgi:hypothetical protein
VCEARSNLFDRKINRTGFHTTMEKRTALSAADLYVMLTREFKRRQSKPCNACFIQLPYRVDRSDSAMRNWELPMPPDCGGECRGIIEDLYAELSRLYDLKPEGATSRQ